MYRAVSWTINWWVVRGPFELFQSLHSGPSNSSGAILSNGSVIGWLVVAISQKNIAIFGTDGAKMSTNVSEDSLVDVLIGNLCDQISSCARADSIFVSCADVLQSVF
eukprot:646846_1